MMRRVIFVVVASREIEAFVSAWRMNRASLAPRTRVCVCVCAMAKEIRKIGRVARNESSRRDIITYVCATFFLPASPLARVLNYNDDNLFLLKAPRLVFAFELCASGFTVLFVERIITRWLFPVSLEGFLYVLVMGLS